ncbi:MAG: radical SAM protein [Deltaproteobacteria bacterium]|nr:MAG: radical SAM protein [Deltaproteobacteria bacterium]
MSEPSYVQLYKEGQLVKRVEHATRLLRECRLCPRQCAVNRLNNEKGFCKTGRRARVASYHAHFGEEAPLVGRFGSGTIFFSFCNLRCSFCQNYEISHLGEGVEMEAKDLAGVMRELASRGCHNINLVTPTHAVPQILEALLLAVENGLNIPIVYNSGGYERLKTLELLRGIIDIYMPDFKFWDQKWAERYCQAPDYREMAARALKEMHAQVGDLRIDKHGIAESGLLVRHLVMPHGVSGTKEVMEFISKEISAHTYVNVMDQYRPCGTVYQDEYIDHRISAKEYSEALESAKDAGLTRLDQRQGFRLLFRI